MNWRATQDSLIDAGIGPDDYEEPGPPQCTHCGAFLPRPATMQVTYGYPGEEWMETRYGAVCTTCGATNYCEGA